LFPLLAAGLLLVVRNDRARGVIVVGSGVLIMAATIWLAVEFYAGGVGRAAWAVDGDVITWLTVLIDVVIGIYIVAKSIQHRRLLAGVLAVAQVLVIVVFEFTIAHDVNVRVDLYADGLSVIMALVIGIIGGGICIYALGYMKDFRAHELAHHDAHAAATSASATASVTAPPPQTKDRRPVFFALLFLFLSAMFGIVFSNNLGWLFTAWEVTTVCSFALIGYTRTEEAVNNSFRQIVMNLLGGLAFAVALVFLGAQNVLELDVLISQGSLGLCALPIALIALAGMTKAAQAPFQSWLLGAMVAPTPTSALLHSSTMVKAGVFILIKLAPAFGFNGNGIMVMLVGALTFLFCSAMAISQSNAKRVLAYSTVANLGLIVACAGVGTPEAVWAAVFLLVFHAAAKSLLFLCVGTAEHHIDSRDIEDMDNLFVRMPALARLMALGVLTMFIAPFGMLISKWATIVSLVETNNLALLVILAFGSAVTFMFWTKWLGKLLAIAQVDKNVEKTVHISEWASIALMAVLVVGLSIGFPFISEQVVVPFLAQFSLDVFSHGGSGDWLAAPLAAIDFDNLLIMAIIVLVTIVSFAVFLGRSKKRGAPIYLSGVGLDFEKRSFRNALSGESESVQRNWYMEGWFSEKALAPLVNTMCVVVLLFGTVLAVLSLWGIGGFAGSISFGGWSM
jgi:ech hydrogenase subunit A